MNTWSLRRLPIATVALALLLVPGVSASATSQVVSEIPTAPGCTVHGGNSKGDVIATCTAGPQQGSRLYRNGKAVALNLPDITPAFTIKSLRNVTDSGWVAGVVQRPMGPEQVARWSPDGTFQELPPGIVFDQLGVQIFGISDNGTVVAKEWRKSDPLSGDRVVWGPDTDVSTYPDAPHLDTTSPIDNGVPQVVAGNGRVLAVQRGATASSNAGVTSWTIGTPGPATWTPCPSWADGDSTVVASPNGRYVLAQCGDPAKAPGLTTYLISDAGVVPLPGASHQKPVAINNDGVALTTLNVVRGPNVTPLRSLVPGLHPAAAVFGRHVHADGTVLLLVDSMGERRYETVKAP